MSNFPSQSVEQRENIGTQTLRGHRILGSIVVSIPACHAGDRGSIPRRGERLFSFLTVRLSHSFSATTLFVFYLDSHEIESLATSLDLVSHSFFCLLCFSSLSFSFPKFSYCSYSGRGCFLLRGKFLSRFCLSCVAVMMAVVCSEKADQPLVNKW